MLDLQNLDCSGVVFFMEQQHIVRISFKVRRQFVQTDKRSVSNCSSTWFGVLISALESFWREHSKWCVPQTPLVKVRGGAFGSVWFSSVQLAWTAFRVRSVIHTSSKAMRWRGDGYHCHRPTDRRRLQPVLEFHVWQEDGCESAELTGWVWLLVELNGRDCVCAG